MLTWSVLVLAVRVMVDTGLVLVGAVADCAPAVVATVVMVRAADAISEAAMV